MASACGEIACDNGASSAYLLKPVLRSPGSPVAPRGQQFVGFQAGGIRGDLAGLGGAAVVGVDGVSNLIGNPKRYPGCDGDSENAAWVSSGIDAGGGGYGSSTTTGASDFDDASTFGCSIGDSGGGGGGTLVSAAPPQLGLLLSPGGATGTGAPEGWIESRWNSAGVGLAVSLDGTEVVGDLLGSADRGWLQHQGVGDGYALDGAEARVMDELFVFEDHFGML